MRTPTNPELDSLEIPTTIREVGIHVAYMRAELNQVKEILASEDKRFITRLEGKAASWVIGVAFAVLTVWSAVRGSIK